jgi:UDP-N-acetylmuramoyl-L-alanyl-D-glutamate--2,6-diaminopimelate ligase
VENALAAIAVGKAEGISLEIMRKALEKIKNIPGRMERVRNNLGLNIIIDYAVTPDSLEKIYSLIRELNKNNQKIISVFGACGERDRGKRPIMGEIVANFCDIAIVTNEDPYDEDPQRIINEVFEGVVNPKGRIQPSQKSYNFFKEGVNCFRILDRREAIRKALELAQTGDFVVITGKGAEETIAIGKRRLPWKEKAIIEEELKGIKKH